jgi:hypothetical protein
MHTERVTFDRTEAAVLLRKYREHRAYSTPYDAEIARLANLIAKGRMVIRALESIRNSGTDALGLPKLAIVRADQPKAYIDARQDGSATMHNSDGWLRSRIANSLRFDFPPGTFPVRRQAMRAMSIVPLIPPEHRPKRGLANYHILFEAEWSRKVPVDPMLLRRVGKGDLWVVLAAWDLTPIEAAVMQAHA